MTSRWMQGFDCLMYFIHWGLCHKNVFFKVFFVSYQNKDWRVRVNSSFSMTPTIDLYPSQIILWESWCHTKRRIPLGWQWQRSLRMHFAARASFIVEYIAQKALFAAIWVVFAGRKRAINWNQCLYGGSEMHCRNCLSLSSNSLSWCLVRNCWSWMASGTKYMDGQINSCFDIRI